jgi:hypothetical protein
VVHTVKRGVRSQDVEAFRVVKDIVNEELQYQAMGMEDAEEDELVSEEQDDIYDSFQGIHSPTTISTSSCANSKDIHLATLNCSCPGVTVRVYEKGLSRPHNSEEEHLLQVVSLAIDKEDKGALLKLLQNSLFGDMNIVPTKQASELYYTSLKEIRGEERMPEDVLCVYSGLSRMDCDRLLGKMAPGSYLLRDSLTRPGQLAVSFRNLTGIKHWIVQTVDGQYCWGQNQCFPSLDSFVQNFSQALCEHTSLTVAMGVCPELYSSEWKKVKKLAVMSSAKNSLSLEHVKRIVKTVNHKMMMEKRLKQEEELRQKQEDQLRLLKQEKEVTTKQEEEVRAKQEEEVRAKQEEEALRMESETRLLLEHELKLQDKQSQARKAEKRELTKQDSVQMDKAPSVEKWNRSFILHLGRGGAETVLTKYGRAGSFIVRPSEKNPNDFAIVFRTHSEMRNWKVTLDNGKYVVKPYPQKYSTLEEVVKLFTEAVSGANKLKMEPLVLEKSVLDDMFGYKAVGNGKREEPGPPHPATQDSHGQNGNLRAEIIGWSVADVHQWMLERGLEQFAGAFRDQAVDGECLVSLDHAQLRDDIGVSALGHRHRILRSIKCLLEGTSNN